MNMKWRWFAVVGISVLLGGCEPAALFQPFGKLVAKRIGDEFPQCPYPGGEVPKTVKDGCWYELDISAVDPTCKEIKGTIARSVVATNMAQPIWRDIFPDVGVDQYIFHTWTFKVDDEDYGKLKEDLENGKNKDIQFFAPAGKAVLTLKIPKAPTKSGM